MSLGLVGRKVGMTYILTDSGDSIPATVLEVGDDHMTQVKMDKTDGYTVVQVAFGTRHANRVTKPLASHLTEAGVGADEVIKEFRVDAAHVAEFQLGVNISVDLFEVGQKIDVQSVTIGKGYTGTIKRYNFSSGRASHGNSRSHNVPGSIGMAQDPDRVFPGKHMTGHMDGITRTAQNLEITKINTGHKLLLIRDAIPDAKGGQVVVAPAVRACAKEA